jgi:hypothetical protein
MKWDKNATNDDSDSRLDYIASDLEHLAGAVRRCPNCKGGFPTDRRDGYWDKVAQLYRCNCMKPLLDRQADFRREVGKGWEEKMPYLSLDDGPEKPKMTDRRFALMTAWRKATLAGNVSRGLLEAVNAEVKSDPYADDETKASWDVVYQGYSATIYDEEPASV